MNHPMKSTLAAVVAVLLCSQAFGQTNDMDSELSKLADRLAAQIKDQGKKKVTVLDFTDLEGGSSELGKYIAEQLTVDLVMIRNDYAVLDRANLKSILAEHKLTATGLINPDNAKKIGQFAGVDAIILGTIAPKDKHVVLTAKIITTDTAEIVGAAKADFKSDDTVQKLVSKQTSEPLAADANDGGDGKPKIVKKLGDFAVELQSLRIVNGTDYLLSINVTNLNPRNTIYVSLECEGPIPGALKSTVEDPAGFQFISFGEQVTGFSVGSSTFTGWNGAVKKIEPHNSVSATIRFSSDPHRAATPGKCHLQLGFFDVTLDGYGKISNLIRRNLTCDLTVEDPSGSK